MARHFFEEVALELLRSFRLNVTEFSRNSGYDDGKFEVDATALRHSIDLWKEAIQEVSGVRQSIVERHGAGSDEETRFVRQVQAILKGAHLFIGYVDTILTSGMNEAREECLKILKEQTQLRDEDRIIVQSLETLEVTPAEWENFKDKLDDLVKRLNSSSLTDAYSPFDKIVSYDEQFSVVCQQFVDLLTEEPLPEPKKL